MQAHVAENASHFGLAACAFTQTGSSSTVINKASNVRPSKPEDQLIAADGTLIALAYPSFRFTGLLCSLAPLPYLNVVSDIDSGHPRSDMLVE